MNQIRTPISKSTRFDIFNRDAFTCQYCGRMPPVVMLEIDHELKQKKKPRIAFETGRIFMT
jgi:5-methylcytosine-specific restriction endonuclease McrA